MGAGRSIRIAFAVACMLALQGCAAVALSVAGMVGGTSIDHTLDGIVYRTYAAPIAGTRLATLQTLDRMGMKVSKSERKEKGWHIDAKATNRDIEIDIEPLSERSTRVRVVVNEDGLVFLKDKSTGIGILDQVSGALSGFSDEKHQLATAQMLLADLGYDPGAVDGLMGRNTRKAIVQFQRQNGLQADGNLDKELLAVMRDLKAAQDAAAEAAKPPALAKQDEDMPL